MCLAVNFGRYQCSIKSWRRRRRRNGEETGVRMIIFAIPHGGEGSPPWLPIVVGCLFIAFPQLVWFHDKRPEAQVSGVTTACVLVLGAAFIAYGVHLWLGG